ncbi:hypothetical protein HK096_005988 [Nowakowskiella sp. JEL0078]|nr:hypothetical protein HK096_005988 [Nowakowskiella sp. JEL0078]
MINSSRNVSHVMTRGTQTLPTESTKTNVQSPIKFKKISFNQKIENPQSTCARNSLRPTIDNKKSVRTLGKSNSPLIHTYASVPFHSGLISEKPNHRSKVKLESNEIQSQNALLSLLMQQVASLSAGNKEQLARITKLEHDLNCSSGREFKLQSTIDAMKEHTAKCLHDSDERLGNFKRETEIREVNLTKKFKHKIRELEFEIYKLRLQEQSSKEDTRRAESELQRHIQNEEKRKKDENNAHLKTLNQKLEYEIALKTINKEKKNERIRNAHQFISVQMGITQNHLFSLCERIRNSNEKTS